MMIIKANNTAITIKATALVNNRKEMVGIPLTGVSVEVRVGIMGEINDVGAGLGVGLGETELAGRVIVWVRLQSLVLTTITGLSPGSILIGGTHG